MTDVGGESPLQECFGSKTRERNNSCGLQGFRYLASVSMLEMIRNADHLIIISLCVIFEFDTGDDCGEIRFILFRGSPKVLWQDFLVRGEVNSTTETEDSVVELVTRESTKSFVDIRMFVRNKVILE